MSQSSYTQAKCFRVPSYVFIFMLCAYMMLLPIGGVRAQSSNEKEELSETHVLLDPIKVPLLSEGRLIGRLNVTIVLETRDNEHSLTVKRHLPQIRSDFLAGIAQLAGTRFRLNVPVDPKLIQDYLTYLVDYRLGKDKPLVFVVEAHVEGA